VIILFINQPVKEERDCPYREDGCHFSHEKSILCIDQNHIFSSQNLSKLGVLKKKKKNAKFLDSCMYFGY
jgi:hypothetical protein